MDFRSLLGSLAKGHVDSLSESPWADLAVGKRRPNAPPALVLTPSQQAISDMHSGAMEHLNQPLSEPTASVTSMPVADTQMATPPQNDTPVEIPATAPGGAVDQRVTGILDQPPPGQPQVSPTGNDIPPTTAAMPVDMAQVPPGTQPPDPHDLATQKIQAANDAARLGVIDKMQQPLPGKNNKWKSIGLAIATSAYNATHPNDVQQVKNWEQFQKDKAIATAQNNAAQMGAIQTANTAEDQKQAQIDYTLGRNPTALEKIRSAAKTAAERQASIDLRAVVRSKKFDPANPAHVALAKTAGLNPDDMAGWDDTKHDFKTVNGRVYEWKKDHFEPTNLPNSEKDQMTDIDVTNENGITKTYRVPLKDEARFAVQMSIAGNNIKSREKIAGEQIGARKEIANNQLGQRDKEFQQKLQTDIAAKKQAGQYKRIEYESKITQALNAKPPLITQAQADAFMKLLPPD